MVTLYEDKAWCCGCGTCENVCPRDAIHMAADEEGALYPTVDADKCVDCHACLKVCPLKDAEAVLSDGEPEVYAARHRSAEALQKSSSGGMFTALSDETLQNGGVVYGVRHGGDLRPAHARAETADERDGFRGSKYAQSRMGDCMRRARDDLQRGRRVLFTGTPCQIAGLRRFLGPLGDTDRLLTADVICFGVPSPALFAEYLKFIEKKTGKKVSAYQHRSKNKPWGHNERVFFTDGTSDDTSRLSEVWKNVFYSRCEVRPSCLQCPFAGSRRPSDISLGDYWGIEQIHPAFYSPSGVSLVLANTAKGREHFGRLLPEIEWIKSDLADAQRFQLRLKGVNTQPAGREAFWEAYRRGGFERIAKAYGGYTLKNRFKRFVKLKLLKIRARRAP